MSSLPKGWVECELKQLISITSGKNLTQKKMIEGTTPVFGGNGITGWHNEGNVFKPTIVIGRVGFYCGSVYITPENAWITDNAFITSFSENHIDREFIYWLLKFTDLRQNDSSSAQPVISGQKVYPIQVKLPPLAEQKRIVEKFDEVLAQVDTIKARLDGIPSLLKRFRQSVLASAVSGKLTEEWRGNNEEAWKKGVKLDSLCESSFYGPRFSKGDYSDVGIPTIRTTDMTASGGINVTPDTPRILVPDEKLEQFKVNKGDLLVTRTGSVGVMAIFKGDYFAIPSAYLIRFRFNASVLVEYVYMFLTSPAGQEIMGLSTTTTTQPNINAKSIRNIEIDLPSIKEQKEIVRLVDQYFAFADTIEAQVKKAQARVNNLAQSILAKAFRGELVPQDPNDEPADKLLERIAQARIEAEALAKATKKALSAKNAAKKKAQKV